MSPLPAASSSCGWKPWPRRRTSRRLAHRRGVDGGELEVVRLRTRRRQVLDRDARRDLLRRERERIEARDHGVRARPSRTRPHAVRRKATPAMRMILSLMSAVSYSPMTDAQSTSGNAPGAGRPPRNAPAPARPRDACGRAARRDRAGDLLAPSPGRRRRSASPPSTARFRSSASTASSTSSRTGRARRATACAARGTTTIWSARAATASPSSRAAKWTNGSGKPRASTGSRPPGTRSRSPGSVLIVRPPEP